MGVIFSNNHQCVILLISEIAALKMSGDLTVHAKASPMDVEITG